MSNIAIGDGVAWKWGFGVAEGVVIDVIPDTTEVESKGKVIRRHGTEENPAIVIEHASGNPVLKLQSEITKTS